MPKGLRDVLDNIDSSEKETAILKSKADKLTSLVERQKRIISEQESLIEHQKTKISKMSDVPEDIMELKVLIGTQRQQLNEKELEAEYNKGEVAQAQKELELVKKQLLPSHKKLEEAFETMGNLRTELAEKSSELILKNEAVKNLNNRIQELQVFTDKFKEEQVKLISQLEGKRRLESQDLKAESSKMGDRHRSEIQELKGEINRLESELLERKLLSTEKEVEAKDAVARVESMKQKYEELISRVGELSDKNRSANREVEQLTKKIKELQDFKKEDLAKIKYFEKLKPLMEKETLFKAFLIVDEVGRITLEDLRNALGSPSVLVRKMVQQLENVGLLETNEQGKIVVKKAEEI
ncbi:MAG: hypothetical protein Lokiarch_32120 [Candidatus Lokiarchaeum sp. GC14_75]|nr:MAG: hypothetical protein Lokiarch_32120 [Candidatus Lokiarchaeum sp. GC14_75]